MVRNPKDWEKKSFKNILKLDRGSSPRPIVDFLTEEDSGVSWIKIGDTKKGDIYVNSTKERITQEGAKKSRKVSKGEIIVSNSMSYGQPYILNIDGYIHDGWFVIRNYESTLEKEFLIQLLGSELIQRQYKRLAAGGVVSNISSDLVYAVRVSLPPIPEQKKIAKILSTWDNAIATTEQLLANSQQQKKAMMQQLLTGKRRLLDKNGVRFSGEWKNGHLSDLGKITKGKALGSKDLIDGNYPVIAGGKSSPYNHRDFTHENVITVSASGAYAGYVAYHPYKLWASDCSVIIGKANSDICFIYHLMSHMQTKIYSLQSGGAQPHVYPKDLEVLRVSIPAIEEQQKIAAVISTADQEIFALKQKLEALKKEKQALMQQLLTGNRRVTLN